jgi:hypothetical protein
MAAVSSGVVVVFAEFLFLIVVLRVHGASLLWLIFVLLH